MTHILVTNDDGVQAPGLLALVQEMRTLGEVIVLAPDRNWSASGHVKTLDRSLSVREVVLADGTQRNRMGRHHLNKLACHPRGPPL